ncbi:Fc.00g088190.m01.CDS01 [Cosmosporella sp. VM-42]
MPNQHGYLHRRRGAHQNDERDAVIRTVYKTMAPTFKGGVAGYTTVKKESPKPTQVQKEDNPETVKAPKKEVPTTEVAKKVVTTQEAKAKATTASDNKKDDGKDKGKNEDTKTLAKATTTSKKASTVPTVIHVPTDTESLESVLAKATGDVARTSSLKGAAPSDLTTAPALASASASATADASSSKSETEGSSPGAKAGIAFGVLGGLLLVGLLVFLAFNRRRKRAQHQKLANDDEKLNGPIGGGFPPADNTADNMSVRTDPKAPRISLRPVTQFLPNWNVNEKRTSKGANMALSPAAALNAHTTTSRAPGGSAWDRPTTSQSIDPANPFGTEAERVPTPIQEESIHSRSTPSSPVRDNSPQNDPLTANGPPVAGAAIGAAVGTAAAGVGATALARKTSMRKGGPKQLDLTLPTPPLGPVPPSPAGTEFSVSSANPGASGAPSAGAAAIAAAGGPANSAVHRVQLDFKATLEDELDLKAGDLVRLLHEYDDGWALVIRLDRSQQGVVPRTCLSTRPVKPRPAQGGPRPGPPVKPAGPPRGPGPHPPQGQRPMTPQGRPMTPQGRPMTPQGRPMTPNGGRSQSPMGRPMSPAGPRSQSPGPRPGPPGGRPMSPGPRSQSPGPRQGPPGGRSQSPSNMNRRNSPPGPSPMNPAQAARQGPPTGPVGRKPVPGQAY